MHEQDWPEFLMTNLQKQSASGSVQKADLQQNFTLERLVSLESETITPVTPPDLVQARSDTKALGIWLEATTKNLKTRCAMHKEVECFIF